MAFLLKMVASRRVNLGQGWAATAKLLDHRSSLDHGHRASTMAAAGWGILLQIFL
jgi:hypothetical protein